MLSDLGWLPLPGDDYRERFRTLRSEIKSGQLATPGLGERLVAIASHALDISQLDQLARLPNALAQSGVSVEGLSRVTLGLVGDGTLSLLSPAIAGSALRHGLILDVIEGHFGSAVQEVMDPDSHIHSAALDMALVVTDYRSLGLDRAAASADDAAQRVEAAVARVRMIVGGLRQTLKGAVLVQTLPAPVEPLFGSFDRVEKSSVFSMIGGFNAALADWASSGEIVLVDVGRLAASVGLERWHDARHWHASKLGFAPDMIPVYADVVARTVAAVQGRARKCLVLDLDNTLWGGVIGDDGVSGIVVGQGDATGEAFLAVQQIALELRGRGVVLAVCSKNEDETARLPFRSHPDMLLREDHIAVFQANWTDKAANLRAIAETLNIGVDALVFLDDNPAERAQVRRELPMVAVPEIGDDPALYPRLLAAAGYFEAVTFSDEDRKRAAYYQANAQRAAVLTASGDLDSYLASLDMECVIDRVDAISRARVAQLINKSNQYNLTTRRYSEAEVQAIEADPNRHLIHLRLLDCFGDNGIISVIFVDKSGEDWSIDTWLMSCRVLGRRVQEAALAHLAAIAKAEGAKTLTGRFVPSPKNMMVKEHYAKLGFQLAAEGNNGETVWRLDLQAYTPIALPMRITDRLLKILEEQG